MYLQCTESVHHPLPPVRAGQWPMVRWCKTKGKTEDSLSGYPQLQARGHWDICALSSTFIFWGFSHALPSHGEGCPLPLPFIATHWRSQKTSWPLQINLHGCLILPIQSSMASCLLYLTSHSPTTFLQLFNLPLYRDVNKLSSCSMREEGGPCRQQVQGRQPPSFLQYQLSLPSLSEIREPPFQISPR